MAARLKDAHAGGMQAATLQADTRTAMQKNGIQKTCTLELFVHTL